MTGLRYVAQLAGHGLFAPQSRTRSQRACLCELLALSTSLACYVQQDFPTKIARFEPPQPRECSADDEGAAVEEAPEPLYLPASGSSRKGQDPDDEGAASGPEAGEDVGSDTLDKALTRSFLAQ